MLGIESLKKMAYLISASLQCDKRTPSTNDAIFLLPSDVGK